MSNDTLRENAVNKKLLESSLGKLKNDYMCDPVVVQNLKRFILDKDDLDLYRLNPIQYARENNIRESDAIDLFLYCTKLNIFELGWYMVCPNCACVVESLKSLTDVHSAYKCRLCAGIGDVDLDSYVQIAFTISPGIRSIKYHNVRSLAIDDYLFHVVFAKGVKNLPNGMSHAEIGKSITKHLQLIELGQQAEIDIDVNPGYVAIQDLYTNSTISLLIDDANNDTSVNVESINDKLMSKDLDLKPIKGELVKINRSLEQSARLKCNKLHINFKNMSSNNVALIIFNLSKDMPIIDFQFEPCLTGKRLLTNQTFIDLFRFDHVNSSEALNIKDITILFTDIKGSVSLYDKIGDLNAFHLIRQHFDALSEIIKRNNGAIIKTIGDAVMAAFVSPEDGAKSAIEILEKFDSINNNSSYDILLRLGLHQGASIAVSFNNQTDYFGQTVNIASRIQNLAHSNEIYTTDNVVTANNVAALLKKYNVSEAEANVRGILATLKVYKITKSH